MAYSQQNVVSDGTLVTLMLSIDYFDRSEIQVLFDDLPAPDAEWDWVGVTDKTISFTPAVATGVAVRVQRITNIAVPRHRFSDGAQFKASTLDENATQLLRVAQEIQEGATITDVFNVLNFHGNRLSNVGYATQPGDAIPWGQYQADINSAATSAASAAASAGVAQVAATNATNLVSSFFLPSGSVNVGFLMDGTGAYARDLQAKGREYPSLLDFIPVAQHAAIKAGTSTYNCTADVNAALLAHDIIFVPPGLYNVSTFNVGTRKQLRTAGKSVTFQQIAGTPLGTRMICVTGSWSHVGSMTVRGNIATDTNEQNLAIFVQASVTTGNIRGVTIGDIDGFDIRGDVLYLAANTPYTLTDVYVGAIYGDNILRNVISICGGYNIDIQSATADRNGFTVLDIEPEPYSTSAIGIRVGYVKGRCAGLNATSATSFISGVEIGTLLLDPAFSAQSNPVYAIGDTLKDGLSARNVKHARIERAEINGFDRSAIFTTYNGGELGANLEFGSLHMTNCSLVDVVYGTHCLVPFGSITVERLTGSVAAGKAMFSSVPSGRIDSGEVSLGAAANLFKASTALSLENLVITGTGTMLGSTTNSRLKNINFTGGILANFCTKLSLENVTSVSSTYTFNSGNDIHVITNSTLNTVYYANGTTQRSYLAATCAGAWQSWFDAAGRFRRKGGIPTSDTDGQLTHGALKGVTGSRPTLGTNDAGQMYFDTTLHANGMPIWWTGTGWVKHDGTTA